MSRPQLKFREVKKATLTYPDRIGSGENCFAKPFSKGESLMKKAIKRIAQKSNRKLQEIMDRMEVNLMLPIAEVLVATRWHIEQLAGAAGMKIIHHIIDDDARQLAGERYARDEKEGQLWGRQRGWVALDTPRCTPRHRARSTTRACRQTSMSQANS